MLGTHHITKMDPPTTPPHKVSLKSLWSSEKYPPDKEESTETETSSFSLFLTVQPRPTACERFHWAEKVLLAQSAILVPSMIHNVVWSPVCL